jgi:hypothetical protein
METLNKNPMLAASGGSSTSTATSKHLYSKYNIAALQE